MSSSEKPPTEKFYERADAHVNLANSHIQSGDQVGETCGSFVYSSARFNAWMIATGCRSAEELEARKEESLEFFTEQYKQMLKEHLEEYISHFDGLMTPQD